MAGVDWDNVLVLQTSFLGDMVLTLPLIAEIRRRFPVKKLSLMCTPLGQELLQDYPAIDEIIVDDKKMQHRGWRGLLDQAALLRQREFTMALTPHKSARTAYLLYKANIPQRIGFRQSKGWFLFHRRAERDPSRHDVERNLAILEPLGVRLQDCAREIELVPAPEVQNAVARKLRDLGVDGGKTTIGVNPGSIWPTKRWRMEGFAEFIDLVKARIDCQVLLFGAPEDAEMVARLSERCDGAAVNLAGKFSLRELPAAIGRCQVFVTNDSGPMHIAVARKVPTVAIFCATTPDLGFYPYSANAIVVQKQLACRPCTSHGGRRCPLVHENCIRQIRPQTVLAAVVKLLAGKVSGDRDRSLPEFLAA
ncbi:MAG TPA: lipopolysaccharide heptosyltransferase II [Candidatus Binatia bacterium]